jgi:hypothetical protein
MPSVISTGRRRGRPTSDLRRHAAHRESRICGISVRLRRSGHRPSITDVSTTSPARRRRYPTRRLPTLRLPTQRLRRSRSRRKRHRRCPAAPGRPGPPSNGKPVMRDSDPGPANRRRNPTRTLLSTILPLRRRRSARRRLPGSHRPTQGSRSLAARLCRPSRHRRTKGLHRSAGPAVAVRGDGQPAAVARRERRQKATVNSAPRPR